MAGKHQAKEKGMISKAIDAIDHAIHPHAHDESPELQVEDESTEESKEMANEKPVAKHKIQLRKFDKFKQEKSNANE